MLLGLVLPKQHLSSHRDNDNLLLMIHNSRLIVIQCDLYLYGDKLDKLVSCFFSSEVSDILILAESWHDEYTTTIWEREIVDRCYIV